MAETTPPLESVERAREALLDGVTPHYHRR